MEAMGQMLSEMRTPVYTSGLAPALVQGTECDL